MLADSSVNSEQLYACLQDVISSEVCSDNFDADSRYACFADAFDIDDAFDPFYEEYDFDEYFSLRIDDGTVVLEGIPLLNSDDHVTRWVAWILFRQFGQGEVLTFSSETIWDDETYIYTYKISRNGLMQTQRSFVNPEED